MSTDTTGIDPAALRGLLVRNWLTHDAMWFAGALERFGIEETNRLNRHAARSMAQIEAKRIVKMFGLGSVDDGDTLRRFFDIAIETVIPDFMDFEVRWAAANTSVRFGITSCFAFDGVSMLGVADRYECGIFERIHGWLDALGVGYSVEPVATLCTMYHEGTCARTYVFDLPPSAPPHS